MPARVGTSTTSSLRLPSKSVPSFMVRLDLGCTTWKSLETSRSGRPVRSGQLPVPASSSVHVTGSPTPAVRGTTLETKVNSPTAPLNAGGAGGSGLTVRSSWFDSIARCSTVGWAKRPKPEVPTIRFTIWLEGLRV